MVQDESNITSRLSPTRYRARLGSNVSAKKKESLMEVSIIENEGGRVVARYTIVLNGQNYASKEEEYHSEAWKCAVDDEVVEPEDRDKYSFSMSKG